MQIADEFFYYHRLLGVALTQEGEISEWTRLNNTVKAVATLRK